MNLLSNLPFNEKEKEKEKEKERYTNINNYQIDMEDSMAKLNLVNELFSNTYLK